MNSNLKYVLIILIFYSLLGGIFLYSRFFPLHYYQDVEIKDYTIKIELSEEEKKNVELKTWTMQELKWKDYKNRDYVLQYAIPLDSLNESANFRNSQLQPFTEEMYGQLYADLIKHDNYFIEKMIPKYKELAKKAGIENDSIAIAEMVVTSLQYQPYNLVHALTCDESVAISRNSANKFSYNHHKEGSPCTPNVNKNGIHSPVEFFMTKKGDCDTRTVSCYALLKKMGYDVAIINTPSHSIFGIYTDKRIGNYTLKSNLEKEYFIWELTAQNSRIGEFSNEGFEELKSTANIALN